MHRSPTALAEGARSEISNALLASLHDGLDLQNQLKVAHWTVRGPHFKSVHELFDTIAATTTTANDDVAERVATLGGIAYATARNVAKASRLPDLPQVQKDLELVKLIEQRLQKHLEGLRSARKVADGAGDIDTSDLITGQLDVYEKHAWMLIATLGE